MTTEEEKIMKVVDVIGEYIHDNLCAVMNATQMIILVIGIIGTVCIISVTYQDTVSTVLGTVVGAMLTGIFVRMANPVIFKESGMK